MPDKLNIEEIKKALEKLIALTSKDMLISNNGVTYGNVLDLINRQEEEKQSLKAENERLKQIVDFTPARGSGKSPFLNMVLDNVRAEAYKEFADWMQKEYADFDSLHEIILPENINKAINDFLKQKGVDSVV